MTTSELLEQVKRAAEFTSTEFEDYYMTRTLGSHAATAEREYQRLLPVISGLCKVILKQDEALDDVEAMANSSTPYVRSAFSCVATETQSQVATMLAKMIGGK